MSVRTSNVWGRVEEVLGTQLMPVVQAVEENLRDLPNRLTNHRTALHEHDFSFFFLKQDDVVRGALAINTV